VLNPQITTWLAALEQRHLANLTRSEVTRALRALSSCYVERRDKLGSGAALEGAGKRAAFALFYGPQHFFTTTEVLRALDAQARPLHTIHDLGCGTGVAGAAWALACDRQPSVVGIDRSAWAAAEASWTYRELGVRGRAKSGDAVRGYPHAAADTAILLAYTVNELPDDQRALLLEKVIDGVQRGAALLIVEPIAKRDRPWWPEWATRLTGLGAREDEWRFRADLPVSLRHFAKGAGLDATELKARTLSRI
jgi:hypothetical protein